MLPNTIIISAESLDIAYVFRLGHFLKQSLSKIAPTFQIEDAGGRKELAIKVAILA